MGKSWGLTPQGTGSTAEAMKPYLPPCPLYQGDHLHPTQGYLLSGFSKWLCPGLFLYLSHRLKKTAHPCHGITTTFPDPRELLLSLGHGNFSQQHGSTGTDLAKVPDLHVSLNLSRPTVSGDRWAPWQSPNPLNNRGLRWAEWDIRQHTLLHRLWQQPRSLS